MLGSAYNAQDSRLCIYLLGMDPSPISHNNLLKMFEVVQYLLDCGQLIANDNHSKIGAVKSKQPALITPRFLYNLWQPIGAQP